MNTSLLPHRVTLHDGTARQYSCKAAAYAAAQHAAAGAIKSIEPVPCARGSTYGGHCADGGGVQQHSAGPAYPYIVFAQESPTGLRHGVMGPDGATICTGTDYDAVSDFAVTLATLRASGQRTALAAAVSSAQWVLDRKIAFKRLAAAPGSLCGACRNSATHLLHPKCGLCDGTSRFTPL